MTRKKIGLALLCAFCILCLFGMIFVSVNRFTLTIVLQGDPEIILEAGQKYHEPGAKVRFQGSLLWKEGFEPENAVLRITEDVNESCLGKQEVRYEAEYLFFHAEALRRIRVVDTQPPVILLTEDPDEALAPGVIYEEAGFLAVDNMDGDITHRVVRTEHMGRITYAVTDSSGNPAYAQREVPFHDPVPPEIILRGGETVSHPVGRPYGEPGYRAEDNVDGDLTSQVTVEGTVDCFSPGTYPITYRVTDAYQNTTVVIRKVRVEAAERPEIRWPESKTIYLTFDDGPGPYTETLLDILYSWGVKATFFVVDSEDNWLMKEIVDRGHSIGIHSVTHDYGQIYSGPEAYFADLYAMQQIIYDHTGVETWLMRFPGGSSNEVSIQYCKGIMTRLAEAVQDAGFRYFDWNVDSDDAGNARRSRTVADNVKKGIMEVGTALVLQHDIHAYSVDAVEEIIRWGVENGYEFKQLEMDSPGFPHPLNN